MKKTYETKKAPAPVGAYSQAVEAGGFVFLSGQIPLAPDGKMAGGEFAAQARQALANLEAVLNEAGLDFGNVVKITVFMTDLSKFGELNKLFEETLPKPFPARAVVGVASLPKGAALEIEAVAAR